MLKSYGESGNRTRLIAAKPQGAIHQTTRSLKKDKIKQTRNKQRKKRPGCTAELLVV